VRVIIPAISLVSVIVPAYNEAATIATTLAEIGVYFTGKPYDHEIIVAADGDDGTRELVRGIGATNARVSVIGGPERRGKGRGVREGVQRARGDVIGFVDADNKTPITEFDGFEPWFIEDRADMVIGSRALRDSRVERPQPWYRRAGSKGFAVVMHGIVGLRSIADTQCGFKFMTRRAAREIFGRQRIDGYMFDVEILFLAERAGFRVAEVPVRWRDDGDSRLRLVSGNVRNVVDLLRIRFGTPRPPAGTGRG
jgi:dolichyl-phosphate beta-glucosyltransferase